MEQMRNILQIYFMYLVKFSNVFYVHIVSQTHYLQYEVQK